jgi:hypothetical protein
MKVLQISILLVLCVGYTHTAMGFAIDPVKADPFTSDSVVIDGNTISIRANVEIDTISAKHPPKWADKTDFAILIKSNATVSPPVFEQQGYYTIFNNTHLPEFGFEFNHPFSKSSQLNYRAGASLGLATRFNEMKVDPDAIGFFFENGDLSQIVVVRDDLQNESDTLRVPIYLMPHMKLNVGIEWHGVMRRARGWRVGAAVEWTPIKDQLSYLYMVNSQDPNDWDDVDYQDTYSIQDSETNSLQVKAFASWSPWNRLWFLRSSILWSPKKLEGGITLGYHL